MRVVHHEQQFFLLFLFIIIVHCSLLQFVALRLKMPYYTKYGDLIRDPEAYAETGAPMHKNYDSKNTNAKTHIYRINCEDWKKYIGKTNNIDRRMQQHANGNGAKVTQKFKPNSYQIIDEVPGYFSNRAEQYHTDENILKYGYQNVRGGKYTNSKTLHRNNYKSSNQYHSEASDDEESVGSHRRQLRPDHHRRPPPRRPSLPRRHPRPPCPRSSALRQGVRRGAASSRNKRKDGEEDGSEDSDEEGADDSEDDEESAVGNEEDGCEDSDEEGADDGEDDYDC